MNPKHKDQVSVCNDSLSLDLLVWWAGICKQCVCLFLIQQNLSVIDFRCDVSNNGKQKQVKATEVYLFWIFCKKNHYQAAGDQ